MFEHKYVKYIYKVGITHEPTNV